MNEPSLSKRADSAASVMHPAKDSAKERLLQSAEQVLVKEGTAAVTVRRVATAAGCNLALVSYHFGGLQPLLESITQDNLSIAITLRTRLLGEVQADAESTEQLRQVINAYIVPMWLPTCHANVPSAAEAIRQAAPLISPACRELVIQRINASVDEVSRKALPLLPHLDHRALLARLRFLLGAAIYSTPQYLPQGLLGSADDERSVVQYHEDIMRFAEGALMAP